MEKILKNRSVKLVFSLVFLTLVYTSCKKDKTETQSKFDIAGTSISSAKESFENNSKIVEPNYTGQSFLSKELLGKRKLDWDNAFSQSNGDTVAVFVPVKLDARITLVDGGLPGTRLDNLLYLRLMTTSKAFDGSKAEMISMIPDQIWEKGKNFSGHMFIENWFVPNISVVSRTKNSTIPTNIGSKKPGDKVVNGFMDCYTATETACVGVGGGETCVTNTTTVCVGGGGGGGGNPGNNSPSDIIVSLKEFPCATAVAEQLPTLKNDIAKILQKTFAQKDLINVTFESRPSISGTKTDGELISSSGSNYVIGINPDVLRNSTKEYILVTLYHEGLHAYFSEKKRLLGDAEFEKQFLGMDVNGGRLIAVQNEGHWPMGYDMYIRGLKDAILSLNPNFGADRALALAQAGIIQLDPKASLINDQERDTRKPGYTGNKCP